MPYTVINNWDPETRTGYVFYKGNKVYVFGKASCKLPSPGVKPGVKPVVKFESTDITIEGVGRYKKSVLRNIIFTTPTPKAQKKK